MKKKKRGLYPQTHRGRGAARSTRRVRSARPRFKGKNRSENAQVAAKTAFYVGVFAMTQTAAYTGICDQRQGISCDLGISQTGRGVAVQYRGRGAARSNRRAQSARPGGVLSACACATPLFTPSAHPHTPYSHPPHNLYRGTMLIRNQPQVECSPPASAVSYERGTPVSACERSF